jgi:hypothetical protein
MTLKELAHAAQQRLQSHASQPVRRSHVHELLAAAFSYRSWAAFLSDALLADAGVGDAPDGGAAAVSGRALQLGYGQADAVGLAVTLLSFIAAHQLTCVRWSDLQALRVPMARADEGDAEFEDDRDGGGTDDPGLDSTASAGATIARDRLLVSPLLLDSLEQTAAQGDPALHALLAALYRCERPNPYLYEESLKGRVLSVVERRWADEYLQLEPRFRRYEQHLKAAALGGVRQAAAEYAAAFDSREFYELAERMTGDVDADQMARFAGTPASKARWLREAAEQGSASALQQLADGGDEWALERLAERGDSVALRALSEEALKRGDLVRAWVWQHLALLHGVDLTRSTMRAYHDGGPQDGEFYDSDFGGPLYVDGEEALVLPALEVAEQRRATSLAREIHDRTSQRPRLS